jgi:hypothetical protein
VGLQHGSDRAGLRYLINDMLANDSRPHGVRRWRQRHAYRLSRPLRDQRSAPRLPPRVTHPLVALLPSGRPPAASRRSTTRSMPSSGAHRRADRHINRSRHTWSIQPGLPGYDRPVPWRVAQHGAGSSGTQDGLIYTTGDKLGDTMHVYLARVLAGPSARKAPGNPSRAPGQPRLLEKRGPLKGCSCDYGGRVALFYHPWTLAYRLRSSGDQVVAH